MSMFELAVLAFWLVIPSSLCPLLLLIGGQTTKANVFSQKSFGHVCKRLQLGGWVAAA